jgi:tetratricopeptide (TPR) repeat protein
MPVTGKKGLRETFMGSSRLAWSASAAGLPLLYSDLIYRESVAVPVPSADPLETIISTSSRSTEPKPSMTNAASTEAAAEAPRAASPLPWHPWLPWLAALLVALGYGIASWPNDFVYDDTQVILEQEAPEDLGDVLHYFAEEHFPGLSYYRPVTRSTLLVQKALHGDVPLPFHLFNSALAGVVLLLGFATLRRPAFAAAHWPAFLAAALFALHPLASSCIYPAASGRETMIPVVFSLAALYTFLRDGRLWTVAAVLTFACALFSKEQAVVLPPLFLLAEWMGLAERGEDPAGRRRRWLRWTGLALVVVGYFVVRRMLFSGAEFRWSVFGEPLGPVVSFLFGLQSVFAPFAALHYEPPLAVWWSPLRLGLALALAGLLVWAAWRWSRPVPGKRGSDPRRLLLFCATWFFLTQLPTANVLVQEAKFSERYVYLGAFGILSLAAAVLSRCWDSPVVRRWTVVVGLVLLLAAAAVSFHRAVYFRDDLAFAQQWAKTNPASPIAHMGVATALQRRGQGQEALEWYQRAIEIDPEYGEAYFNLGNTLADLGGPDPAIRAYREALRHRPDLAQVYVNLGRLLRAQGSVTEALAVYRQGLEEGIDSYELRLGLAHGLADAGRGEDAVAAYREALELNPDGAAAYYALGTTLLAMGRTAESVEPLRQALALDPESGEAHVNLGAALAQEGRLEEALLHYAEGVRLRPDDPAAQLNYGVLLAAMNRPQEALQHLQSGVELNPAEARGQFLLGQALERLGRPEEARVRYARALELAPGLDPARAALERLGTP